MYDALRLLFLAMGVCIVNGENKINSMGDNVSTRCIFSQVRLLKAVWDVSRLSWDKDFDQFFNHPALVAVKHNETMLGTHPKQERNRKIRKNNSLFQIV